MKSLLIERRKRNDAGTTRKHVLSFMRDQLYWRITSAGCSKKGRHPGAGLRLHIQLGGEGVSSLSKGQHGLVGNRTVNPLDETVVGTADAGAGVVITTAPGLRRIRDCCTAVK